MLCHKNQSTGTVVNLRFVTSAQKRFLCGSEVSRVRMNENICSFLVNILFLSFYFRSWLSQGQLVFALSSHTVTMSCRTLAFVRQNDFVVLIALDQAA